MRSVRSPNPKRFSFNDEDITRSSEAKEANKTHRRTFSIEPCAWFCSMYRLAILSFY